MDYLISTEFLKKQDSLFYVSFSFDKILEIYFLDDYDSFILNYYFESILYLYFWLFFYYKYFNILFYKTIIKEVKEESKDYFYKKKVEQLVLF